MKFRSWHLLLFVALLLGALFPLSGAQASPSAQAGTESHEGVLSIVWGNTKDHGEAVTLYFLHDDDGVTRQILLDDSVAQPFGGVLALNGKRMIVRGASALAPAQGGGPSAFYVTSISLVQQPNSASNAQPSAPLVSGSKPWVSIMCKFSDVAAEPKNLAYFQGMFSSLYPGFDHFWMEQSYGTVNLVGSTAVGWYTLPSIRVSYLPGGNLDHSKAATDCTAAANANVNFANYAGINLMFNDHLDGYAWGGTQWMTLDGVTKSWSMTWEPPWGYEDITVVAHEVGHGFGLPHSSGKNSSGQPTTYNNRWDVMSDTWSDCGNSTHATYGCLGQGIISYHKDMLGWIPGARKFNAPGGVSTITLEQLSLSPQNGNYLMAQIPIGATGHFYTVEVRRKVGYDVKLPGEAVIIHEVWPSGRTDPADVVDADGNGNTGDAGVMWVVGETFSGLNGISVHIDSQSGTSFTVTITTSGGGSPPAAFNKSAPSNGATSQPVNPTLGWGASSGATSYEYCYDTSNDNACSSWVGNGASTSAPLSGLAQSTTYYWQVRALNGFGTTDANGSSTAFWSFTTVAPPPPPLGPGTYDDTHSAWAYTGTWTTASAANAYFTSYKTTGGGSATVYFSGTQAKLFFTKKSNMGNLDVYIDDVKVTNSNTPINQYNSTAQYQRTWLSPVYTDGVHKITFTRKTGKVNVDALQVIGPPAPVGPGTYENTNANWKYSGTWTNYTVAGASGGTVHLSSTAANSTTLTVSGASGFTLRYFTYSTLGSLDVFVDGVKITTLIQGGGPASVAWQISPLLGLSPGTHTIKLTDASGTVNFDNIVIAAP